MAIAEWRGWKFGDEHVTKPNRVCIDCEFLSEETVNSLYPQFTDDLNAMHEVKQELRSQTGHLSVHNLYRNFLIILMGDMNPGKKLWENGSFLGTWTDAIQVAEATAMQEAVAFTKAIGKWKE